MYIHIYIRRVVGDRGCYVPVYLALCLRESLNKHQRRGASIYALAVVGVSPDKCPRGHRWVLAEGRPEFAPINGLSEARGGSPAQGDDLLGQRPNVETACLTLGDLLQSRPSDIRRCFSSI